MRGGDQVRDPLLAGDPADERHDGPGRIDAEFRQHRVVVSWGCGVPDIGVDAVADHVDPVRVQRRIGMQHVGAHPGADGDHRGGRFDRRLLHPGRDPVATAELLGLPRTHRLQRVRGQHVRDAVEQGGQVPGHAGVPRVGMHDGGRRGGIDHVQVGRQRGEGEVGALQGRVRLRDGRLGPRSAHAVHVHLAQMPQLSDELGDVDARSAVHLGWVLPSHHRHPHAVDRSRYRGPPRRIPNCLDGQPDTPPNSANGWPLSLRADRLAA